MRRMQARVAAVSALAVLLSLAALSGCAVESQQSSAAAHQCDKQMLRTHYKGVFTFATDQPAYPPWFIGDDPTNGEGFEAAVAYAVADRLGYPPDEVAWVRVPFNTAMAPGPKPFDAGVSQFSITEQRRELVDFTSPYYDVAQAVLTLRSSPAAAAHTVAELRPLRIGAQVGTTSSAAARAVNTDAPISVYNTNIDAKIALRSGQIDALILDLPTAIAIQNELDGGLILGRLPAGDDVEQLGFMLDQGSPLTACVSGAVDSLRNDGELAELEKRWLSGAELPALEP